MHNYQPRPVLHPLTLHTCRNTTSTAPKQGRGGSKFLNLRPERGLEVRALRTLFLDYGGILDGFGDRGREGEAGAARVRDFRGKVGGEVGGDVGFEIRAGVEDRQGATGILGEMEGGKGEAYGSCAYEGYSSDGSLWV